MNKATIILSQVVNDKSTGGKNRHCTETPTTKIAWYLWLNTQQSSTTKPHAKLKGERS